MLICLLRNAPAARGTGEKSLLQKIGFVDILERNGLLIDRGGERFHADRTAGIILDDAAEHAPVERVEPEMVDLQPVERLVCHLPCDNAVCRHLRKIAHAAKDAVGDTRRAAAAAGDLLRPVVLNAYAEDTGAALNDAAELLRRIQLQTENDTEAVAQRRGKLAGACCRADERKFRQIEPNGVCGRSLANDDVDGEVLHRGI